MPRATVVPRSLRAEHIWHAPAGAWAFDTWGDTGRPVLLLHATQLDRASWWPVAAELASDHTVIAVDLPGHGLSAARTTYVADAVAEELAALLHQLGIRRAPIVVGHADAAILGTLFAARFTTSAVVNVQQDLRLQGQDRCPQPLVDGTGANGIPSPYQHLLGGGDLEPASHRPHWLSAAISQRQVRMALERVTVAYLNIFSELPAPGYPAWLAGLTPSARCVEYGGGGEFPHLADLQRFVADIRTLS